MRSTTTFAGAGIVAGAYTTARVGERIQVEPSAMDTPLGDIGPDQPRSASDDRSILVGGGLTAALGAAFLAAGLYGRVQANGLLAKMHGASRQSIEGIVDPAMRGSARIHDARALAHFASDLHGDHQPFSKIGAGLLGAGAGIGGGTVAGQRTR